MTSTCKHCGGSGYIWHVDENGYESVEECACQIPPRIDRFLKNSGVDPDEYKTKNLSTFLTDEKEAAAMKAMAEKYLNDENALGIGYFGKSGTGKTHICIAICQELTRRKMVPHLYFSYRREIQNLKSVYYDQEEYNGLVGRWSSCAVLYIDDLLKLSVDQKGKPLIQELQILFDIINNRYLNKKRTIFSGEYTLREIISIDEALGSRIYDMIKPYGMTCEGKNRRISKK